MSKAAAGADRQPNAAESSGGVFASGTGAHAGSLALRTTVFDADTLRRSLTRIAHEIVERNEGADDIVLVGLYSRGVELAERIARAIESFERTRPPVGAL